jgi:molybdopterin-guanine dinucleotide biosynthesis protein A
LLERALDTLGRCCDRVVVVAPRDLDPGPLPAATGRGVTVSRAFDAGEGPLGGAVASLGAGPFACAVLLGVDFPLMRSEALATLLARLAYSGAGDPAPPAVVPAPDGGPQPLAAVYAWSAVVALAEAFGRGERSIVAAVANLGPRLLSATELADLPGGLENFLNLNRPEDRVAAERLLKERAAL